MRVVLCILALIAAATPSAAYQVAGWDVDVFPETGAPSGCIMGGTFQDATRLNIVVTTKYEWGLALYNPTWNLKPSGSTDIATYIDQRFVASGKATHWTKDIAMLPLEGASVFRALQAGQRLDLQTPYGNLNFALAGTSKAMAAVLACVQRLNNELQPKPAQSAQGAQAQFLSQAEARQLLIKVFDSAGIQNYGLDAAKADSSAVNFTLSDGTRGFFRAARGSPLSADEYTGALLSMLADLCKGDFLSGKQSVPSTDGSVVRKIVSTCRMSGFPTETETTVIRRPSGFVFEYTQILGPDQSQTHAKDRQQPSPFVEAVLRMPD